MNGEIKTMDYFNISSIDVYSNKNYKNKRFVFHFCTRFITKQLSYYRTSAENCYLHIDVISERLHRAVVYNLTNQNIATARIIYLEKHPDQKILFYTK